VDAEADAAALLSGQRGISRGYVLVARVEGIDGRCARRCERRQATIAAADVNNAFARERDEVIDRGPFDASLVTAMHV